MKFEDLCEKLAQEKSRLLNEKRLLLAEVMRLRARVPVLEAALLTAREAILNSTTSKGADVEALREIARALKGDSEEVSK